MANATMPGPGETVIVRPKTSKEETNFVEESSVRAWTRQHPWLAVVLAATAGNLAARTLRSGEKRHSMPGEESREREKRSDPIPSAGFFLAQMAGLLVQLSRPVISNSIRAATGRVSRKTSSGVGAAGREPASRPRQNMAPQPPAAAQRPANARFGQPTAIEKSWWNLVKLTVQDWQDDKASKQGAALAYYTIFSIAPVVVITLMIAGFFLGQRANDQFYSQLGQYLGEQGTGTVRFMAEQVQQSRGGTIAWIGSIAALLLAATGLFAELQDSLDTIWEVRPKTQGIWNTIRDRFLSFLMVLGAGLLILVSFILTSVLGTIAGTLEGMIAFPVGAAQIVTYLTSFLVITLLFALIFKVLPDVEIQWKDVWVGAVVTALLFVVGMYLFSLYLRYSAVSSAYGLLGSILILLLWAYYSAQILFLGAEFTQVYSKMYGGEIRPANNAEPINAEDRAALGLSPIKSSTVAGRG